MASDVRIGLIGGSGLGQVLAGRTQGTRHEAETPFGRPSDTITEFAVDGMPVFFLSRHGPGHTHNPSQVPYRANIFALKQLGVTHIIASGAVGSLREELRPRDLVVADQIIDKTTRRAGTFFERAAVHAEFADPFCPVLREILREQGKSSVGGPGSEMLDPAHHPTSDSRPTTHDHRVHPRGCYVCMEGPAFSTRAESHMHRLWGGDLIGMTAMPEAKLAREAEIGYALVALVTDYDCWKPHAASAAAAMDKSALLKEIIANLQAASDNALHLIQGTLARIAASPELQQKLSDSPARKALELAIWSDKARIPREEVELLKPLWINYF